VRHRAPEVRHEAVEVIDGLDLRGVLRGSAEQDRARAEEGLDVVGNVAEPLPHLRGDSTLAAEPRERGAKGAHSRTSRHASTDPLGSAARTASARK
jgi:hypothetical protein